MSGKEVSAVLIAGPTASGKSALALDWAEKTDGVVVNADSMQVYDTLSVLTARPTESEMGDIPHFLYGHVSPTHAYSVGQWTRDVERLLEGPELDGRTPVFVGGTGLYFKALLGGLSDMPDIPEPIRASLRERLGRDGPQELHAELADCDPDMAAQLDETDGQRIIRALEIFQTTGQSLQLLQSRSGEALIDGSDAIKLVFRPDRPALRKKIRTRFEQMMEQGAVEEVEALLALNLSDDLPAMKAIGVREIAAFLAGQCSRDEAVERASIASGQYAKRQMTWFRNQLDNNWTELD